MRGETLSPENGNRRRGPEKIIKNLERFHLRDLSPEKYEALEDVISLREKEYDLEEARENAVEGDSIILESIVRDNEDRYEYQKIKIQEKRVATPYNTAFINTSVLADLLIYAYGRTGAEDPKQNTIDQLKRIKGEVEEERQPG